MTLPKRRGLALTIIGAVLILLIAPVAVGIGIWQGVSHGVGVVGDRPWVEPHGSIHITGHESQTILVEGTYGFDEDQPTCEVTDPAGAPVTVNPRGTGFSVDIGDTSLTRVGSFSPNGDGDYAIDCEGVRAKVLDSSAVDDATKRVLIPLGIGIGLAVVAFLLGVVLLIVGILKLVNSGRERNQARIAAAGYPGPYGGPAPYRPQPGDPKDPYRH